MRVCVALGIPFREIDLSADYKRMVVEDMIAAYSHGITPNPDVLCNRHIKFGRFLNYALREGADYIATGHYARIGQGKRQKAKGKSLELFRGADRNKDQSYFLYTLGQQELARTLFPVGGLQKKEVRILARQFGLPVAQKADSQGLCFVGDVSMKDFLSRYIKLESGHVLDPNGNIIGRHDGAALYTIGQRHGFNIERVAGERAPHYVISVDIPSNSIRVSSRREDASRKEAFIDEARWIADVPPMPFRAQAQTRYREHSSDAVIAETTGGVSIAFEESHIAAPGQSLVIYDGEKCLGGGIIRK